MQQRGIAGIQNWGLRDTALDFIASQLTTWFYSEHVCGGRGVMGSGRVTAGGNGNGTVYYESLSSLEDNWHSKYC